MKTQFQTFLIHTYCRTTYPKGIAPMQMYKVVPIAKIENWFLRLLCWR